MNAVELRGDGLDLDRVRPQRPALLPLLGLPFRPGQERREFPDAVRQVIVGLVQAVRGDPAVRLGGRRAGHGLAAATVVVPRRATAPLRTIVALRRRAVQVRVREVLAHGRANGLVPASPCPPSRVHVGELLQQRQRVSQQAPLTIAVLPPGRAVQRRAPRARAVVVVVVVRLLQLLEPAREAIAAQCQPPNPLALPRLRDAADVEQPDALPLARRAMEEVGRVLPGAVRLEEAKEYGRVHLDDFG
mmetsp:Transcript_20438/g.49146  ORF Transcript_20438/g.49146 Transcript_20438/m.49146 type:complete len:246 (-) Transcript_20438:55-792(-)